MVGPCFVVQNLVPFLVLPLSPGLQIRGSKGCYSIDFLEFIIEN